MNYWEERAIKSQETLSNRTIKDTEKQLAKYYSSSMRRVVGQFLQTYKKVMLDKEEGYTPTPADLYKLDTYWMIQGELKQELQRLGEKQEVLFADNFRSLYIDAYNDLSLPAAPAFATADLDTAEQAIREIWCADGKSWSNRVWHNTEILQETLNDELIHCVITGADENYLKERLMYEFGVSFNRADSLVKTEVAHIQTKAAQKRYEDSGIKQVYVWADEDERRCKHCGALHEKRYFITEQMPIPAHPRCRCRLLPVIEFNNQ